MTYNLELSIVSPVYRADTIIPELVRQIKEEVKKLNIKYEIILVNDASPDKSWSVIQHICKNNTEVIGVNLSRNFGQHYAITAGLSVVRGQWVVVMDCDLQDRPDEIKNLLAKAKEGYYIVQAKRLYRQDSFTKKLSSHIFHKVYAYLSGVTTDKDIANFGVYHYKVIKEFNRLSEHARSFPTLISQIGFSTTTLEVQHAERLEGKSSYTLRKLLTLSLNVILSNSNKPLRLTVKFGLYISGIAFLLALYNVLAFSLGIITVPGFTSTIFSIWFLGGLNIFVLGVVSLYIEKIYDEVKGRPLFVIQEILNRNFDDY